MLSLPIIVEAKRLARRVCRPAPLAVVLGVGCLEIVRSLAQADIPCGVIAPRYDGTQHSRYARAIFDWDWGAPDDSHDERLVERLVRFAEAQPERPTLYYCSEQSLLFVSRYRTQLERAFRFVISDAELVNNLTDKALFSTLARRLSLPVPATCTVESSEDLAGVDHEALRFPLIVKPTLRDDAWESTAKAKALRVDTVKELRALVDRLKGMDRTFVVQHCIDGPETAIESYHVYVDESGQISGEFTGRKIRTLPAKYGHSTALTLSNEADLLELGRKLVNLLRYRGVAKFDFKRSPSGELYLLEINARFNLWHLLGAHIGINIPAIVYADLTGRTRPEASIRGTGTATWVHPRDIIAARNAGVPLLHWLRWAARCEATPWSWKDPIPFIITTVAALAGKRQWLR